MSNVNFDQIDLQTSGQYVQVNGQFQAVLPANFSGIDLNDTAALSIAIFGGEFWSGSAFTTRVDGTTTIAASSTNYIEEDPETGAITDNASAFTTGQRALYTITSGANGYNTSGITDFRRIAWQDGNVVFKAVDSRIGESASVARAPGKANINTTAVGNVGVGEDDLMTYAMPASALSAAGKGVQIVAWGTTANNANAKTVKLYFGTVAILTTVLTVSQVGVWRISAEVFSTGTDAQDYIAQLVQGGATTLMDVENGSLTQDDGATITIKCTGEATTTDDIKQEGLLVSFYN